MSEQLTDVKEQLIGTEVVSALATQLRARFTESQFAKIYKNKPVQSMVTPCIFIHLIETQHTPDRANYAWWNHNLDIRCHPGKMVTNINTWAQTLSPIITECVEYITIAGQKVKSNGVICRVEDDVLHILVNYKYRVLRVLQPVELMQTLEYGQSIK